MKCCITCRHFTDGNFSKTYISPTCTKFGTDAAAYIRAHVCTLDGIFHEPKQDAKPNLDAQSVAIPRAHSD